jgi:Fur family ferric uptake transcriptional regulator
MKLFELEKELDLRGIKATAMRLLILRTMREMNCAVSLTDLENKLVTVDKSTIFRTLMLFLTHHLVHCIDDGSGFTKYALCADDCHCGEEDDDGFSNHHTHFFCETCHRTFCLRGLPVPEVAVPEGFILHTANYVLKGLCPECAAKKKGKKN